MFQINKQIEVITMHEINGAMIPLRFRIEDDDGKHVCKLKVKRADKDKTKIAYRCMTEINGQQREVELHYILLESKWILFNMR